jgi:TRAP-type C4-dicarboxylate transport system substrate-binding protein
MKNCTRRLTGVAAAAFTACAISATTQAADFTMRIGMVTINDAQHTFAKKYGEELAKRTNGKIKVSVFPAGQLGKIPTQIENLKIGAQAAFLVPAGFFSGINRAFQVTDAPGIFKSYWHAQNAITEPAFRSKYLAGAEKAGIIGVSIWNYGPTSIASFKPIRKIDDMKGLKIRVLATKMESKIASVLGMTGVPMPFTAVLPALQQHTIDGCRAPTSVMTALKFYTATKNVTIIESGMVISVLWVSKAWLNKLPKPLQNAVMKTGQDLQTWAGHNAKGFVDRAAQIWTKNGGEVLHLSATDMAEVTRRLAPLGDEFLGTNPATKDMYELLKKALAKASTEAPKS